MPQFQVQNISVKLAYAVTLLNVPTADPREEAHEFPLSGFKSTGELAGASLPGKPILGLQVVIEGGNRRFVLFRLANDPDTTFDFDTAPNLKAEEARLKVNVTLSDPDTGKATQVANVFQILLKDDNRRPELPNIKWRFLLRREESVPPKYSLTYEGLAGGAGGPECAQLPCFDNPDPDVMLRCVYAGCYNSSF